MSAADHVFAGGLPSIHLLPLLQVASEGHPPQVVLLQPRPLVDEGVGEGDRGGREDLTGELLTGRGLATGAGAEQSEEGGQEEQTVHQAEADHQEDHLGEGADDVADLEEEGRDAEEGGDGTLDDRGTQGEQTVGQADMGGEVSVMVLWSTCQVQDIRPVC